MAAHDQCSVCHGQLVEMLAEKKKIEGKKKPSFKDYPTRIDKLKVPVIQSMNVQKQYTCIPYI